MNDRAIHAYITRDQHDAWHDAADVIGCTVSSLVAVLGDRLDTVITPEIEREARLHTAGKRRRQGGRR